MSAKHQAGSTTTGRCGVCLCGWKWVPGTWRARRAWWHGGIGQVRACVSACAESQTCVVAQQDGPGVVDHVLAWVPCLGRTSVSLEGVVLRTLRVRHCVT